MSHSVSEFDIAIIGCAGRFPGAENTEQLWEQLLKGESGIRELRPDERTGNTSYTDRVWQGGVLDNPHHFDPGFFGISDQDAELMDPQLRIAIEQIWQTLEQAGYSDAPEGEQIGLYMGAGLNQEWIQTAKQFTPDNLSANYKTNTLTYRDFFATKVAYLLGLKGPAITINTACSTSLVSVHLACQSLLADECHVAVAGGVHLLPVREGYQYQEGMILSKDGTCKPFDKEAAGTVWGEGAGFIALKRAESALADGDQIIALIKSTAVNNDGQDKAGYTAPSVAGQTQVVKLAAELAEITPADLCYVETHGTGTKLGDPLEIKALLNVYGERKTPLTLGAVKANVGHLDVAAGITGLIKTALCMKHRCIPPHSNFEHFSPSILALENHQVLQINKETVALPQEEPCYAGVSSFGIGGTNAHVILATPPPKNDDLKASSPYCVLTRSYQDPKASQNVFADLNHAAHKTDSLTGLAFSLQHSHHNAAYRAACVVDTVTRHAVTQTEGSLSRACQNNKVRTVFVFPGQGSQYRGMGHDLYQHFPLFKHAMDECFSYLKAHGFHDPKAQLFTHSEKGLEATDETQPLLFSLQYSLAKALYEIGIKPDVMIGHSLGELVAATLAGVMSLHDAIALVIKRGQLMSASKKGAMVSVEDLPSDFDLPQGVTIALYNSPKHVVLAGSNEAIETLVQTLTLSSIKHKTLRTRHAFHTQSMTAASVRFQEAFDQRNIDTVKPQVPIVSNVTGSMTKEDIFNGEYWASHILNPVQFSQGIAQLLDSAEPSVFIEVGPAGGLSNYIRQHEKFAEYHSCVGTLGNARDPLNDTAKLFSAIAQYWCDGGEVSWSALAPNEEPHRVAFPPYRFHHRPFTQVSDAIGRSNDSTKSQLLKSAKDEITTHTKAYSSTNATEPLSSAKACIEQAWQKVFGAKPHDLSTTNFFSSGGDSLTAVSFSAEIKEQTGIMLPLQSIMESDNLKTLANTLDEQMKKEKNTHMVVSGGVNNSEKIPLSAAQERMWVLDQLSGISDFHICEAFRLKGHLSIPALQKSCQVLIERHPILRTHYQQDHTSLHQVVSHDPVSFEVRVKHIQAQELTQQLETDCQCAFDLCHDLMLRCHVYQITQTEAVLLLVVNHIAADGASMNTIANELMMLYSSFSQGITPELPLVSNTYTDYVNDLLHRSDQNASALTYWQQRLQGAPQLIQNKLSRQVRQAGSVETVKNRLILDVKTTSSIDEFCQKHRTTSFVFLSTIFGLLLAKTSDQSDISLGTTIADRQDPRWKEVVGFFTNTLIIRNHFEDSVHFDALLSGTQSSLLEGWQHLHVDFSHLIEKLGVERSERYHPLFQNMMVSIDRAPLELEGLSSTVEALPSMPMLFDLYLTTWRECDEIIIEWTARKDLYDHVAIESLQSIFTQFVHQAMKTPTAELSQFMCDTQIGDALANNSQHSDHDTETLLSNTTSDLRHAESVLSLYYSKSEPDATAIIDDDGQITYRELESTSNQLAHLLVKHGVPTGAPVAISLPRGRWQAIAILAIFKIRAHYVPIDSAYPESRVNDILSDAKVAFVLDSEATTRDWACPSLSLSNNVNILQTLASYPDTPNHMNTSERGSLSRDDKAYLIYTSGSTGRPKGVPVTHTNLVHYCVAAQTFYGISRHDKVAQITSIGFDASVEEHMMALCFGATLVYRNEQTLSSLPAFADFIQSKAITVASLPTGLWHVLCDELDETLCQQLQSSLRLCILGGEALQQNRLTHWQALDKGNIQLLNTYGPTETTVIATVMDVTNFGIECNEKTNNSLKGRHVSPSVPIGRPIPYVTARVMDDNGLPVPQGMPGELWISGPTVTQGYLNREEQTQHAFVNYIDANGIATRCYRTGDKVLWQDEQLIYLGRIDNQIKYRGFRIEPGEVESTLTQLPDVQDAIVDLHQDTLSAWVASSSREGEIDELLHECHEKVTQQLPEHLRPRKWAWLPQFALNAHGKVDRQALPAPTPLKRRTVHHESTPHKATSRKLTSLEAQIAPIWQNLLQCDAVCANDNFFEQGGHSLKLTRLFSQIKQQWGVAPDYAAFFAQPTLANLATLVDNQTATEKPAPIKGQRQSNDAKAPQVIKKSLPIEAHKKTSSIIIADPDSTTSPTLSLNQSRLWFLDKTHDDHGAWMLHFAWTISGAMDVDALQKTLDMLVIKHVSLRTSILEVDLTPELKVNAPQSVKLRSFSLRGISESADYADKVTQERDRILAESIKNTIRVTDPVLMQSTWIEETDHRSTLLLSLHHMACDGWSMGTLFNDFDRFYSAITLNQSFPSLLTGAQYSDFAAWQWRMMDSQEFDDSKQFWLSYLKDLPTVHQLPLDFPRPTRLPDEGSSINIPVPDDIGRLINKTCGALGVTPFMLFHTGLSVLFGLLSDSKDIVLSTAVANRTQPEFESVVGFFVHTMLLRCQWQEETRFSDLLSQQRADLATCYTHQDVPVDMLIEALKPERSTSHAPLTQLMMVFQNNDHGDFSHPDISVEPYDVTHFNTSAKFDIYLSILPNKKGIYECTWEYNTALFKEDTIRRFAHQLNQLIHKVCLTPQVQIRELSYDGVAKEGQQDLPAPTPLKHHTEFHESSRELTPLEAQIAPIWQRILQCDVVYASDNFFEQGGHSLKLTRLFSQIKRQWGVVPDYAAFFAQPTLSHLATQIAEVVGGEHNELSDLNTNVSYSDEFANYYPMTSNQQQLWFMEKLQGPSNQYCMNWAYHLVGTFDAPLFEYCVQQIQQRHAALRTTFFEDDKQDVWQKIHHTGQFALNVLDLRHAQYRSDDPAVHSFVKAEIDKYFTLENDELLSMTVLQLTETEHVLVIRLHHIISDGWSVGLLFDEIGTLYSTGSQEKATEKANDLAAMPIHLGDIALTEQAEKQNGDPALDYWKQALANAPECHSLPLDHPRPNVLPLQGKVHWHQYTQPTEAIERFCKSNGYTPFMAMMAAFSLYIGGKSRQNDVVIGTPVANRIDAVQETMLGYFANTVPIRSNWKNEETFSQFMERTRANLISSYSHQTVPFQDIVNHLHPKRSLSYAPVFQVMMVLQNNEFTPLDSDGLEFTPLYDNASLTQAKFDLMAAVYEDDGFFDIAWEYNTALFESSTIEQWAKEFNDFMVKLFLHPEQPISKSTTDIGQSNGHHTHHQHDIVSPLLGPDTSPVDSMLIQKCIQYFEDVLGLSNILAEDNFFDIGGHSLLSIKLIGKIEKEYGVRLEIQAFFLAPTPMGLAHAIDRQRQVKSKPQMPEGVTPILIKDDPSAQPIVLLPGIGGLGNSLHALSKHIEGDRVMAFHLFDPTLPTLEAVAVQVVSELERCPNVVAPVFAGHSLGGCLAALCQTIWKERTGYSPQVVLIDSFPLQGNKTQFSEIFGSFIALISHLLSDRALDENTFPSNENELHDYFVHHHGLEQEQLSFLCQLFKVYKTHATYAYFPAPNSIENLTLISAQGSADSSSIWNEANSGTLSVESVPGDHYSLLTPPLVEQVARIINQLLANTSHHQTRKTDTEVDL